ncbi:MAG: GAF domain-containing sensor histidine kinase, partial [Chloroflexi bacterium]|nr:GAF domain-containing sensor histidine kinase [Chloroflexota bacterium]
SGHPSMTTFLGAPIRYRGEPVGSLYLTEKSGGVPFTASDEEVVRLFANQGAVAIHNARLYEQIQALAVETERERISHEMHDGLAQVLSYVNTKAQAVQEFLASGDVSTASEQLSELSEAARDVYGDVREGILALRSSVGAGRSLKEALEEYIEEYQQRFDGTVSMTWGVGSSGFALTPLQEVQLIRIVQEALTNVRKHAEADNIWVSFTHTGDDLHIEVKDDGRGFNPLAVKRGEWPHLGLQTMQERAAAVGGDFEIESEAGRGTTVHARLTVPTTAVSTDGAP